MLDAYGVDTIRELEATAIAEVGDDTLMQRAASGLAAAVARAGRAPARTGLRRPGPGPGRPGQQRRGRPVRRGPAGPARGGGDRRPLSGHAPRTRAGRSAHRRWPVDRYRRPGPGRGSAGPGQRAAGGRPGGRRCAGHRRSSGSAGRRRPVGPGEVAEYSIPTIAVDLPSGVGADTGAVPGEAFWATQTVTFGERKPCHLVEPARQRCGEVEVIDIGLGSIPPGASDLWLRQWEVEDLAAQWPYPDARSDKYSRGVVGIDTGSDSYPGAAIMNVYGAVHAGAGMVRFLGADRPAEVIGSQLPNVVFAPGRVQAHLFGSGWGERADGAEVLQQALKSGLPTVVDADGLKYLPEELPTTGCSPRTPGSWRRCSARSAPGSPRTRSAPFAPGWPRPGRRCCSRAPHSWSPARSGTGSRWPSRGRAGPVRPGRVTPWVACVRP